jgi:sulfur carrier protein ThiS
MQLVVKLYGTLRRLSQPETPGRWEGSVPDGLTVEGLVEFLGTRIEEVAAATINGTPCLFQDALSDGDTIVLVTPFGGG